MPDPIGSQFGIVVDEITYGAELRDTLQAMADRWELEDMRMFVVSLSVQSETGGNLAEILDSIAYTIRERVRIKGEIRTLTAQQRLSGYVVAGLPIGLAGILFIIAPGFMAPMFLNPPAILGLPAGLVILMFGGFMMFLGFLFIRKIVDIEV